MQAVDGIALRRLRMAAVIYQMMEKDAQHPDTQWKKAHNSSGGSLQAATANKIRYQQAQLMKRD